jgi:site-specific recombinase XerD
MFRKNEKQLTFLFRKRYTLRAQRALLSGIKLSCFTHFAMFRMKKSSFSQAVTAYVFCHHHVQKSGLSSLYLRVIIDRKKKEFPLNQAWPAKFFDADKEIALQRFAGDLDVDPLNMVIGEAKTRANRIKTKYFSENKKLTIVIFREEFLNYLSADNFMNYWKKKMAGNRKEDIITETTKTNHTTSYNRLAEYLGAEVLLFNDISLNLVKAYNAWARKKKGWSHNTVCTDHKTFRSYMQYAMADKIKFDYPYDKFSFKFVEGEREALEEHELEALKELYGSGKLTGIAQEVLRKFLFSCYTGLRVSDTHEVHRSMIRNGKLHMNLIKGFNFGKQVHMTLPDYALQLIKGRNGLLFEPVTDQTCNRYLKSIAILADIEKKLTFHVSRDTFGTLFIEMGGDVYTLMGLMGHSSIETTMIYIKMSEKRKDLQMQNMNKLGGMKEMRFKIDDSFDGEITFNPN